MEDSSLKEDAHTQESAIHDWWSKLLVENVDPNASENELYDLFGKFGKVNSVHKNYKSHSTALVSFADKVDIGKLKEGISFNNRVLVLKDAPSDNSPPSDINCLPDETLLHIFSFLSIVERLRTEAVCKRWLTMNKNIPWRGPAKLYLGLAFFDEQKPMKLKASALTDNILASILSRCGACLRDLELFRFSDVTDKALGLIGKYCPNLTSLKLYKFPTEVDTEKSLLYLARQCPKLEKVCLHSFNLTDQLLYAFLGLAPKVKWLELGLVINFVFTGVCLAEIGKNLKGITLDRCETPTSILSMLQKGNDNLEELGLTFCSVSSPVLLSVCSYYKDTLKVLHLEGQICAFSVWEQVIIVLRNLEELSLAECPDIKDNMLEMLVTNCAKLRVLNVGSTMVTDVGVAALSASPILKVLDISYTRVAGGGIDNLAVQGQLEELYARKLPKWANDLEVGCMSLIKYCPKLRILDVSGNKNISSKLIEAFQAAVKRSFFQEKTVELVVLHTMIQGSDFERCDGLRVVSSFERLDLSGDDHSDGVSDDDPSDNDDDSDIYLYSDESDSNPDDFFF